jgi:3-oxoacyl-[acyl-carrier protein] reductase
MVINMNKTALITGASGGIGRAIAIAFAKEGMTVGLHYRSNQTAADTIAKEIEDMGQKAYLFQADLSNSQACQVMIEEATNCFGGQLDILVNNAGITNDGLLLRMGDEQFESVIQANLNSCFYCTRSAISVMAKARKGSIVNISSIIGLTGNAGQANYAASKAAIIAFSKSCAKEMAKRKIRVNVVAPGYIQTPMTDILSDKVKIDMLNKIPLKRLGEPEDVANVVAFLASDAAAYMTGQVLVVDGGMIM